MKSWVREELNEAVDQDPNMSTEEKRRMRFKRKAENTKRRMRLLHAKTLGGLEDGRNEALFSTQGLRRGLLSGLLSIVRASGRAVAYA